LDTLKETSFSPHTAEIAECTEMNQKRKLHEMVNIHTYYKKVISSVNLFSGSLKDHFSL